MERLGIVRERKVNYRALGERDPTALEGISNCQIVEVFAANHGKRIGSWRVARQSGRL